MTVTSGYSGLHLNAFNIFYMDKVATSSEYPKSFENRTKLIVELFQGNIYSKKIFYYPRKPSQPTINVFFGAHFCILDLFENCWPSVLHKSDRRLIWDNCISAQNLVQNRLWSLQRILERPRVKIAGFSGQSVFIITIRNKIKSGKNYAEY